MRGSGPLQICHLPHTPCRHVGPQGALYFSTLRDVSAWQLPLCQVHRRGPIWASEWRLIHGPTAPGPLLRMASWGRNRVLCRAPNAPSPGPEHLRWKALPWSYNPWVDCNPSPELGSEAGRREAELLWVSQSSLPWSQPSGSQDALRPAQMQWVEPAKPGIAWLHSGALPLVTTPPGPRPPARPQPSSGPLLSPHPLPPPSLARSLTAQGVAPLASGKVALDSWLTHTKSVFSFWPPIFGPWLLLQVPSHLQIHKGLPQAGPRGSYAPCWDLSTHGRAIPAPPMLLSLGGSDSRH